MAKGVKKNLLYQSFYEILIILLPLATSPYIARVLGVERIGIYSYTFSVANYFVLVAGLGIKNYGSRTIAQARDTKEHLSRTFSSIYCMNVLVIIAVIAAYFFYLVFIASRYRMYALIQTIYVIACLFDINWFYFGIEEFKLTVTRNTIIKIMTVCAIFLFVRTKDDLWKYCLIMAVGTFISQSVVWFFLPRYVKFIKPTFREMVVHIKPLLILFIPVLAISLYKVMDKIMLGIMSDTIQVGYYENAEKAVNIPNSVINAFGAVMLPKMANLAGSGNVKESRKYIYTSMEFLMCVALALAFGVAAVAEPFSVVFWGDAFAPCGPILQCLSVTVPFLAFANVLRTQYLIPNKKDISYIISVCGGAVMNLTANALLIPHYGAVGAGIGTILAEVTVCVVQTVAVSRELDIKSYIKNSLFFIALGAVMYAIVVGVQRLLGGGVVSLLLEVLIGGLFYLIFTLVWFVARKNEMIMKLLNKYLWRRREAQ